MGQEWSYLNDYITVPEYINKYVNKSIDLEKESKCCCPFHNENTASFSYKDGRARCFGSCKDGGDVVDMHRMHYKLPKHDRKGAEESLARLIGAPVRNYMDTINKSPVVIVNEEKIEAERLYQLMIMNCGDNEDKWVESDYVMSFYPYDVNRVKDLLTKWGVKYEREVETDVIQPETDYEFGEDGEIY